MVSSFGLECQSKKDIFLLRFVFLDSFSLHMHLERMSSSLSKKTGGNKKQSGMMEITKIKPL